MARWPLEPRSVLDGRGASIAVRSPVNAGRKSTPLLPLYGVRLKGLRERRRPSPPPTMRLEEARNSPAAAALSAILACGR